MSEFSAYIGRDLNSFMILPKSTEDFTTKRNMIIDD